MGYKMKLLKRYFPNNRLEDKLDLNIQQFSAHDLIGFANEVAHLIVNDAICSPDRVKSKDSNSCADFVDRWFNKKNN